MLLGARTAAWSGEKLPYDAEVEWLESTGSDHAVTMYIDTGIAPAGGVKLTIKARIDSFSGNTRYLCGSDASNHRFGIAQSINSVNYSPEYRIGGYYYGGPTNGFVGSTFHECSIDGRNGQYVFDGVLIGTSSQLGSYSTNNILLFKLRGASGNFEGGANGLYIAMCKIENDSGLLRDMIPVRVGSVGYMYDRVSKTLFGNAGTGAFVVGPDKT